MPNNSSIAKIEVDAVGARKDTLSIIDKRSLEIVRTVTPEPNKTVAHVEFDNDGRHTLVSVCENDGALVITMP
ncbi:cytochrome D1 domain-containing protein [Bradyrhizobium sp.]|uniref:cytochrome D1 domain-containing protein n=1 Tax=Bradyrhizobium sp. TaxID=376 RepID=UPI003C737207